MPVRPSARPTTHAPFTKPSKFGRNSTTNWSRPTSCVPHAGGGVAARGLRRQLSPAVRRPSTAHHLRRTAVSSRCQHQRPSCDVGAGRCRRARSSFRCNSSPCHFDEAALLPVGPASKPPSPSPPRPLAASDPDPPFSTVQRWGAADPVADDRQRMPLTAIKKRCAGTGSGGRSGFARDQRDGNGHTERARDAQHGLIGRDGGTEFARRDADDRDAWMVGHPKPDPMPSKNMAGNNFACEIGVPSTNVSSHRAPAHTTRPAGKASTRMTEADRHETRDRREQGDHRRDRRHEPARLHDAVPPHLVEEQTRPRTSRRIRYRNPIDIKRRQPQLR